MEVKIINKNGRVPTKATEVGYDLYASEDVFIPAGESRSVSTGIAVNIPTDTIKVQEKSSLASKGLRTKNETVNFGFQGEIEIVLQNLNCIKDTDPVLFRKGYQIRVGDKIAYLCVAPTNVL